MTAPVSHASTTAAKGAAAGHAGQAKGATPAAGSDAFAALMDAFAALDLPVSGDPALVADPAGEQAPAGGKGGKNAKAGADAPDPSALPAASGTPGAVPLPAAMLAIANAPQKGEGARREAGTDAAASAGSEAVGALGGRGRSAGAHGPGREDAGLPVAGAAEAVPGKPHAVAAEPGMGAAPAVGAKGASEPAATKGGLHELAPAFALHAHAVPVLPDAAPAPGVPVHQAALPSHPLDTAFAGDLAAEVQVMAQSGVQRAELRLNPADLGPVRIELALSAQTADIQFTALHATTREGIEQALPQLREMLAASGLQLGQAGVGAGPGGQATADGGAWRDRAQAEPSSPARGGTGGAGAPAAGTSVTTVVRRGRGMLDLYA